MIFSIVCKHTDKQKEYSSFCLYEVFKKILKPEIIERYHEVELLQGIQVFHEVGLEPPSMHEYLHLIECF